MRTTTAFRLTIGLPIVIPLALVAPDWISTSGQMSGIGVLVMVSAGYWLIPYVLFAVLLLWWSWKRTATDLRATALRAPLLFIPLLALYNIVIDIVLTGAHGGHTGWLFETLAFLAVIALIVGYGYVALAFLMVRWLCRFRL